MLRGRLGGSLRRVRRGARRLLARLDTPRPSPGRRPEHGGLLLGSRLGRLIVALNLLGLVVLIGGALVFNELRRGLVGDRIDSLTTQGELIGNVMAELATVGAPQPALDGDTASRILQFLFIPRGQRARLFSADGTLLADSEVIADRVEARPLPPAHRRGWPAMPWDWRPGLDLAQRPVDPARRRVADQALALELRAALNGDRTVGLRRDERGERVVSVSIPIQRVQAVLGVLTLESGDVDAIVARQRLALAPFILIAVLVTLGSSLLLTWRIAEPATRLARAADRVRLSRARAISLPDLAARDDELGDLTRSLEDMTATLSERMGAIERFAADVAHEIRNPLTSIRSAVETLPLAREERQRERLLAILQGDVKRLDRLITDIANASRLDAELARDTPHPLDLSRLLGDIVELYEASARPGEARVTLTVAELLEPPTVLGRDGPLGQVFRNLIDNARSFSPPDGTVQVRLERLGGEVVTVVEDQGPGIPPENLETVFERFYTSRPKGAAFGGSSGLGLSIARQIVEAHGGRIGAENLLADDGAVAGTRFTVALPARRG